MVTTRRCSVALAAVLALAPLKVAGSEVVISQVFGGGGNAGAPLRNDFVELFNRGAQPVALAGWSLQYSPAAGSSWQVAPLDGVIAPGGFLLIQAGSGGANGSLLPLANVVSTINFSASAGKLAVVRSTAALSGTCPGSADVQDLIGYGATASCFEGSGPAPSMANAIALFRASHGCFDSGDNSRDFYTETPTPRNSGVEAAMCQSGGPLSLTIHQIQGSGLRSPFAGSAVIVSNAVVTALRTNAVFVQTPDEEVDGEPETSEGLVVVISGVPSPVLSPGDRVSVRGIVQEFRPASDPDSPPRTQLVAPSFTLHAQNQAMPESVVISPADLTTDGGLEQLERFEGMRVRIDALTAVSGTEGFVVESSAIGASRGIFYGVFPGRARPFREPGIPLLDLLPAGTPPTVPRFDLNPERLRVDSDAQPGATSVRVTSGATISNLVGVLDFEARLYTLLPDGSPAPVVTGNVMARPGPVAASNELTVACFNLQRFYDTVDDGGVSDVVLTPPAFDNRLRKLSFAIRSVLRNPDILGVEEAENLETLQAIAARIDSDAVARAEPVPNYQGFLFEGNDPGGIDVGLLVKPGRISVSEIRQMGKDATFVDPNSGQPALLNDRPPIVARLAVNRDEFALPPLELTVVVNHLRSLNGIDDPVDGFRVRAKRLAQAEFLADLVQSWQEVDSLGPVLLMGDFNAFSFNDGYVDVMGVIRGDPADAANVVLAGSDRVEPDLINLMDLLPVPERYTYVFDGHAQVLDHILVNEPLYTRFSRIAVARNNADFPETYRSDPTRPERISDHDVPVAYLTLVVPARLTAIRRLETGEVCLVGTGEPGLVARVEASIDLAFWEDHGDYTIGPDGTFRFTVSTGGVPGNRRFFRMAPR